MSEHKASISWKRSGPDFIKGKYSREHTWTFDGGATIPASAAPSVVGAPWSNAAVIDPEEAFVAAISSCHMLTFVNLASLAGFQVEDYHDAAVGVLTKKSADILWVSAVVLKPKVTFSGDKLPTPAEEAALHHRAHELCYITNSVQTQVTIEAQN